MLVSGRREAPAMPSGEGLADVAVGVQRNGQKWEASRTVAGRSAQVLPEEVLSGSC